MNLKTGFSHRAHREHRGSTAKTKSDSLACTVLGVKPYLFAFTLRTLCPLWQLVCVV